MNQPLVLKKICASCATRKANNAGSGRLVANGDETAPLNKAEACDWCGLNKIVTSKRGDDGKEHKHTIPKPLYDASSIMPRNNDNTLRQSLHSRVCGLLFAQPSRNDIVIHPDDVAQLWQLTVDILVEDEKGQYPVAQNFGLPIRAFGAPKNEKGEFEYLWQPEKDKAQAAR